MLNTFVTFILGSFTAWTIWNVFKLWYVIRDDSYLDLLESMGYDREEVAYWTPKIYNVSLWLSVLAICAFTAWIGLS